jgi:hypothetical protein
VKLIVNLPPMTKTAQPRFLAVGADARTTAPVREFPQKSAELLNMNTTFILNPLAVTSPRTPPPDSPRRIARQRAYRRALRAAEQAAWEAADPKAITRLPRGNEEKDSTARVLFSLLVFSGVATLVFSTRASLAFTSAWADFVSFIQHVLP